MKDAPYISARSKVSGARRTYEQAARLCEEYAKVVSDFETHGAVPLRPAWADMPHSVASAGAYSRKHQQQLPKERSIWAEREHRAAAVRQAEALLPPEEDFAVRIGIVEGARVLRARCGGPRCCFAVDGPRLAPPAVVALELQRCV